MSSPFTSVLSLSLLLAGGLPLSAQAPSGAQIQQAVMAQQRQMQMQTQMNQRIQAARQAAREAQKRNLDLAARQGASREALAEPKAEAWRVAINEMAPFAAEGDLVVVVAPGDAPLLRALNRADGKARWEAKLDAKVECGPLLAGDLVLVGTADDKALALDRATGKVKWHTQLELMKAFWADNDKRTRVNLTVDEGRLLVATHGKSAATGKVAGKLYSLDLATGTKQWERPLDTGACHPAMVMGDCIVVGGEARLYGFQASPGKPEDGQERWKLVLDKEYEPSMGVDAEGTYAFTQRYKARLVDLKDGKILWQGKDMLDPGSDGHRVFWRNVQWSGTTLSAQDPKTAANAWSRKLDKVYIPWVEDGLLFFRIEKEVIALKAADGQDAWRYALPKDVYLPPLVLGGKVLAWAKVSDKTHLVALDPKTGQPAWTYQVAVKPGSGMLHADGQGILFPGVDGVLVCLK